MGRTRPAYRVRFEDDSIREIEAEDLPRYGSQVIAEAGGAPRLDQVVRWIEVEVPIRFLPAGVSLLDTPGMGSLHSAHTEITQRFVPQADAVIFVLESGQVVGDLDLTFLESILTVTRNILFIQTKIDQYRASTWQEIQRRNQEILTERFGDRLVDPRVWPISCSNLLKGAQTGDEDYVIVSRHRKLGAGLRAFLFRVAGWDRAAEAVTLAADYQTTSRQVLAGRHTALTEASKQRRIDMQRTATERKRRFEAEWGTGAPRRKDLDEGIRRIGGVGRQSFAQALRPGGAIARTHESKIEAVTSGAQARAIGQMQAADVIADVMATWRQVCDQVETQAIELFKPFAADAASVVAVVDPTQADLTVQAGPALRLKSDMFAKMVAARLGGATAFSAAGLGLGILVGIGILALPVAGVGVIGAGIWGLVRGWKAGESNELDQTKRDLRRHLGEVLQLAHRHFFDVDQTTSRFSLVDEYFTQFERLMKEQVRTIADRKSAEAQAEVERLTATARFDDERRNREAEKARQELATWDELGRAVAARVAELNALDAELTPRAATAAA